MVKNEINFSTFYFIMPLALIISLSLSIWMGFRENVINPDGICYLLSAQYLSSASIKEAMYFCPQAHWPFYSVLINAVVNVTQLSYLHAAQCLNAIFALISVSTFLLIIKELGANKWVMLLAAIVFLFNHQLNVLRDNVIRDHGFWAFYLVSLFLLLRFFHNTKATVAFLWAGSLLIATLFRIEGLIFLLFMPFIAWFNTSLNWSSRARAFFLLNSLMLSFATLGVMWILLNPQYQMSDLGRVTEVINQLLHGWQVIKNQYFSVKLAMAHHVLPAESHADTAAVTLMTGLSWYLYNVCITFSLGYALLVLYAVREKIPALSKSAKWVVGGYLLINFVITMGFLAENLFISKRYLIALTLVLMIWVPFALYDLILKFHTLKARIFLIFISLIIVGSGLSGIIEFGYSKTYIKHAGHWMEDNIPKDAKLYANDFQLMYYSRHFGDDIFKILPNFLNLNVIAQQKWQQYDYLAIKLSNKEDPVVKSILAEFSMQPIKDFRNKRGNHIAIYQVKHKDSL